MPVTLGDVATVQIGPEMRRGVAELNGEGEVAGGVVVLRSGKNAREVIAAVKDQARGAEAGPAAGRRDRADLRPLEPDRPRGRQSRQGKLIEEFIVVALVCGAVPVARCARRWSRSSRCRSAS